MGEISAMHDHVVVEAKKLFGQPPILKSEKESDYYLVLQEFWNHYKPKNFLQKLLIRDMTNALWDEQRYTRNIQLAVEQKLRRRLEFQLKRAKVHSETNAARQQAAQERKEMEENPELNTDSIRELDLEAVISDSADEITDLLNQEANDHHNAQALRDSMSDIAWLDDRKSIALERRYKAWDLYKEYSERGDEAGLGDGEIVEADFTVNEEAPNTDTTVVPPSGEQQ